MTVRLECLEGLKGLEGLEGLDIHLNHREIGDYAIFGGRDAFNG